MKITEALIVEHTVFTTLFDQIERVLPELTALAEVKLLAALVEGLLHRHGGKEDSLAYLALDHVLEEQGELTRLHHDHQEIDARLEQVRAASDLEAARQLLKAALLASREHFRREERTAFPLIERKLQSETLTELGNALKQGTSAPGSIPQRQKGKSLSVRRVPQAEAPSPQIAGAGG